MYQKLSRILERYIHKKHLIKYGFNYSPMYRRSTGRITKVTDDLHQVDIEIPLNWKNINIAGSIFGGSMFAATDPIYMTQLMFILGTDYIVWDKSANIRFRRPARKKIYGSFTFSKEEVLEIKKQVDLKGSLDVVKQLVLTTKEDKIIAELEKTIYVSTKLAYQEKLKRRK